MTTATKHTRGPWLQYEPEFESRHGGEAVTIIVGKVRGEFDIVQEVAYVNCDSSYFNDDRVSIHSDLVNNAVAHPEAEANARLIAAAPDMLEALRTIVSALEYRQHWKDTMPQHLIDIGTAAIAKATGEQS